MTATAKTTLIAPRANGRFSGGFLVNAAWLESPLVRAAEADTVDELERTLVSSADELALVDSIYLYDANTASVLARAARMRAIALLAHSLPSLIPGPPVAERLTLLEHERAFLSKACGAIAPSRFMAAALARRGLDHGTIQVVRPAPVVDGRARLGRFPRPARTGPLRILTVANWTPAKGIEHAVRALGFVVSESRGDRSRATDWTWTLIGSDRSHPEYSRRVRNLMKDLDLARRIEILPPRSPNTLTNYYAAADLFLLPSLMESYGLVFSEAAGFGMPIVGYRCAAVPEALDGAGELVDAGDIRALAAAVRATLARAFDDRERVAGSEAAAGASLPDGDSSRRELESAVRILERHSVRCAGPR